MFPVVRSCRDLLVSLVFSVAAVTRVRARWPVWAAG